MEEFFDFAARGARWRYRHKPLVDCAYYHVFKRREDGMSLFRDDVDRRNFVEIMQRLLAPDEYRDERGRALRPLPCRVELIAFCILDNHYHLILWVEQAAGLTDFMHRLQTAYAKRFNNRHRRQGQLFDERYDARIIEGDFDLKTAIAYVHANPGAAASTYEWSSHRFYLDRHLARHAATWLATATGLTAFNGSTNYLAWFMRAVAARVRRHRNSRR
jgi:REP element-mobilizing transposase RayT